MYFVVKYRMMKEFQRPFILFPTDFSPRSDKAIEAAYLLEKLYRGEVVLFHAVAPNTSWSGFFQPKQENDTAELALEAHKQLDEYRKTIDPFRMHRISTMVGVGKPETAIVEAAIDIQPRMIVIGHRSETTFFENLFGTSVHHVLRNSPFPVLSLRNPVNAEGFTKIILPIDATKESTQKLQWGIRFANLFNAELHLFSVISTSGEDQHAQEIRMKNSLEQAKNAGVNVISNFRPMVKGIAETIMAYAQEVNADLICIMTQQEADSDSLRVKMMGSVADKIVNNSDMAVLSIVPDRIVDQYRRGANRLA